MTITIQRGKSQFVYRINEFQPCEIDWRKNRHNARWARHSVHATPEIARQELLKLEKKEAKP